MFTGLVKMATETEWRSFFDASKKPEHYERTVAAMKEFVNKFLLEDRAIVLVSVSMYCRSHESVYSQAHVSCAIASRGRGRGGRASSFSVTVSSPWRESCRADPPW